MEYLQLRTEKTTLEIAVFAEGGAREFHLFVKNNAPDGFAGQLSNIGGALDEWLQEYHICANAVVFARYFVSDYANQATALETVLDQIAAVPRAVSIVEQPPIDGNKVAAWFYIIDDGRPAEAEALSDRELRVRRGGYEHLWSTRLAVGDGLPASFYQTAHIFENYSDSLEKRGGSLKDNCIRTWLFVKDIDFNYGGLVEARRELFRRHGMTEETHFISSTGIGGRCADPQISVMMDAYAVGGVRPEQIRFLEARENLNPTHEYSVTFERGTSLDYGDRRHIFISGTASIDSAGKVLHTNDVRRQADRAMENIAALLADADADLGDVAQMIVYLRDISDAGTVSHYFHENHRDIPKIIVLAPVCRPGWLVEIECTAIRRADNPAFGNF